jgi:hypothetical protein
MGTATGRDKPMHTHDARVWFWSAVRTYLEAVPGPFFIVGDSAYLISPVLMKPYSKPQKCLFNEWLSSYYLLSPVELWRTVIKIPFSTYSPETKPHTAEYW